MDEKEAFGLLQTIVSNVQELVEGGEYSLEEVIGELEASIIN